ncbi:uncharacterized protein [Typha angustifolia]|uniref:uncharacterized protein n=1 Tax=Typha angustifolia TaxID=59011 RepID=UPI003C2DA40A
MAEFPPNLDDGELWLPSEIIPDLGVRRCSLRSDVACADGLAHQLAAFGFLDRARLFATPNTTPHFEWSRPARTQFGPAGRGVLGSRSTAVYEFAPVKPVHPLGRVTGSRRSQGTGVFLPRVLVDSKLEKKANVRGAEQLQRPRQPSPELALPQDWTY